MDFMVDDSPIRVLVTGAFGTLKMPKRVDKSAYWGEGDSISGRATVSIPQLGALINKRIIH